MGGRNRRKKQMAICLAAVCVLTAWFYLTSSMRLEEMGKPVKTGFMSAVSSFTEAAVIRFAPLSFHIGTDDSGIWETMIHKIGQAVPLGMYLMEKGISHGEANLSGSDTYPMMTPEDNDTYL